MRRNGSICILLGMVLAIMVNWSIISAEVDENNSVLIGDFSDGTGWRLKQNEGGTADLTVSNHIVTAKVSNPGRRPWSVLVEHGGLSFKKDLVYKVSFEARSQDFGRIQIEAKMDGAPYGHSGCHFFPLNNEFHQYSFTFTMRQATDNNAIVTISLGRLGTGSVDIANVRVTCTGPQKDTPLASDFPKPFADRIMRGITFGNTLDAPQEGAWSPELREDYFDLIKEAGLFDHIRLPVRWNTHALTKAPYAIDPEYMHRVEWAVSQALRRGFYVVLNMHYFDELADNPPVYKKEFIALWDQIAEHFKDYPENLYFEIYNEPQRTFNSYWNTYYPEVYDRIRMTNPARKIIISCPGWANITTIDQLILPKRVKKDPNILVQFHFYYPNEFCFQGSVGNGWPDIRGYRWTGTERQKKELTRLADKVLRWSKQNGDVRLWNGEFCAHAGFSLEEDRLRWTAFVIRLCEERDIAWAYWDFNGDTSKIYDSDTGYWNNSLLEEMKNAARFLEH